MESIPCRNHVRKQPTAPGSEQSAVPVPLAAPEPAGEVAPEAEEVEPEELDLQEEAAETLEAFQEEDRAADELYMPSPDREEFPAIMA